MRNADSGPAVPARMTASEFVRASLRHDWEFATHRRPLWRPPVGFEVLLQQHEPVAKRVPFVKPLRLLPAAPPG